MPWATQDESGEVRYMEAEPTYRSEEDGGNGVRRGVRCVEIDSLPGPFEEFDFDAGCLVTTAEVAAGRINRDYEAAHGMMAIALARATKAIEARLILAGVAVPGGIVALEAEVTGQDPEALAAIIVGKAQDAATAEVARIEGRRAARGV